MLYYGNSLYNISETKLLCRLQNHSFIINKSNGTHVKPNIVNFNINRDLDASTLGVLQKMNPDKLVLGYLNINSIINKFDGLLDLFIGNIVFFLLKQK